MDRESTERLDEILLVAQRWAGVDCTLDLRTHFLVGAITLRVAILLDQHQDVVDVDLDRGEIPSRRFGRRIVVFRHELERMFGASGAPTVQMDIEAGTMNSTG